MPVPPRMMTRTWSSASAARKASFSSTSSPRLCALRALRPVQHDADNLSVIDRLVGHVLVLGHPGSSWAVLAFKTGSGVTVALYGIEHPSLTPPCHEDRGLSEEGLCRASLPDTTVSYNGWRSEMFMNSNDMVLVSVDDHVVEPPHLFEGRLPAKYADLAPQFVTRGDGTNAWLYEGAEIANVALNAVAGRPAEEYGMEPTSFAELRAGCYDIDERVKDMDANGVLGSLCFPSFPQFCGQLFARTEDKEVAPRDGARLQRLAHRRLVRHPSRPVHPLLPSGHLGSTGVGSRGFAGRRAWVRMPSRSRKIHRSWAGRASTPTTGDPFLAGLQR